jgi:hypothetical protein
VFQKKISINPSKWQVRGLYLKYKETSLPDSVQSGFLSRGFLLSPTQRDPLILPGILSPGEEAKLAELLGE